MSSTRTGALPPGVDDDLRERTYPRQGAAGRQIHVGLNLLYLLPGTVGGTETYARGLLDALPEVDPAVTYTVFVNEESADWPLPDTPAFRRVVCPVRAASRSKRYWWEQVELPRLLKRSAARVDLLHSLGYVMPLRAPCPTVVTIHDLNYRSFGRAMPLARRLMLRFFVEQSARRASRVITVSHFSRTQLLSAVPVRDSRVHVTHEAARPAPRALSGDRARAARAGLGLAAPYLVAFSSGSPNKNIPRLLEAFALARREHGLAHELVLVGHAPWAGPEATPGEGVRVTGYLDDATLAAVLSGADALVFPSTYEGFGLPVLEAMRSGVPVACSRVASLPEIAGDAALFFDPWSTGEIAQAMVRLAGDPALRARLQAAGREREGEFTWERTARETVAVYRAALQDTGAGPGSSRG